MNQSLGSVAPLLRRPSAFVPIIMSIIASAMLITYLSIHGLPRQTDEGPVAHLWQILIAGQLPIIAFFAFKWLPRAPRQLLPVLALQTGAILLSMVPVLYFHL